MINMCEYNDTGNSVQTHPSFGVISARFIEAEHDMHLFNQKVKSGQAVCIEVHQAEQVITANGFSKFVPTSLILRCVTSHAEFANLILKMNGGGIHITHQIMLDPNASVSKIQTPENEKLGGHVKINHNVLNDYKGKAVELSNRLETLLNSTGKKDIRKSITELRDVCSSISKSMPEMSEQVAREFVRVSDANREITEEKTRDKLKQFIQQKRIE